LLGTPLAPENAATLEQVRFVQRQRLVQLANDLADHPASTELAAALMMFPLGPQAWQDTDINISIEDGETIGRALYEIGRFAEAQPWYERAVEAKQQGDIHGRVDDASLGSSLREGAHCLRRVGRLEQAKAWEEAASRLES
jgi:tetratricopeptide (TPR) repeat protein